jgi:heavy metal sensor kinase
MRWHSFRIRLTFWNIVILALVLGGFGLTVSYTLRRQMGAIVDQDLARRASRWQDRNSSSRTTVPRPPAPGDASARDALSLDSEAERVAFFRAPRLLDLKGKVIRPAGAKGPWDPSTLPDAIAGQSRYSTIAVAGERVRVLSVPWLRDGKIAGAIQVARELGDYERLWSGQLRTLLALLPVALLVAAGGGFFLTDRALRPVHQVTDAAERIGAGDLSRRLEVQGKDELAKLAETFNGMIARLEAAFEQQRRFTADASHELRTPLARIKVSTSMALAGEQSPEEYRTALRVADQAADAMSRLVQQLLLLARADAGELPLEQERLDLADVLRQASAMVPEAQSAPLVWDLPPEPLAIKGDADHLARVFVNLLENAIRHTPAGGQITLRACARGDTVIAQVIDTGEGIPPEHLPHLGERFYRVDAARARKSGGSGLGLAISRNVVELHGGRLAIESELGRGTTVTVTLPRGVEEPHGKR